MTNDKPTADPIPEAGAPISYAQMTLAALRDERDRLNREIGNATGWGAALAARVEFRDECEAWITRREKERNCAGSATPSPQPPAPAEGADVAALATSLYKWSEVLDIPSGWYVNEDCRLAADALTAQAAEIAAIKAARWTPVGDNHHNAALCPYCNPQLNAQAAALAAKEAEIIAAEARYRDYDRLATDEHQRQSARIAALEAALQEIKHHAHNADAAALWFGEINRIVDAVLSGKEPQKS